MHKEKTRISDRERKCLEQLVEWYGDDERNCVYMKGIAAQTGLDMAQVRRSVRSLARKGLAEYQRGLGRGDFGGPRQSCRQHRDLHPAKCGKRGGNNCNLAAGYAVLGEPGGRCVPGRVRAVEWRANQ